MYTHTHTHSCITACLQMCTLVHTSVNSTCLYTQALNYTHTHAHAQMHARIRGSHGGWCAALCSRIGSSASCELDSPGSVLIPAALFRSPHIHTRTPVPAPAQQRALLSLFCLFAPVFLYFFSFSSFLVSIRPCLSLCCDHRLERPQ